MCLGVLHSSIYCCNDNKHTEQKKFQQLSRLPLVQANVSNYSIYCNEVRGQIVIQTNNDFKLSLLICGCQLIVSTTLNGSHPMLQEM